MSFEYLVVDSDRDMGPLTARGDDVVVVGEIERSHQQNGSEDPERRVPRPSTTRVEQSS
jgi:hypothetical protein